MQRLLVLFYVMKLQKKIKPLGAGVIINSTTQDVSEILKTEEDGTPVNVSMGRLCGETLGESLPFVARGGYWIVISTLAVIETDIQL